MLIIVPFAMKQQEKPLSQNITLLTINAPQLDVEKKIWVYLPYNYNNANETYPVLYIHDGQNLFDRNTPYTGEKRGDEVLDELQLQAIVIGIEHGEDKRTDELTPYTNEKYGGGNGDAYVDFIINTLKPYIDKTFRTKPNFQNTFIMGKSLGALISYYAMLKYPGVFGKVVAFSPSFWFSEEIYNLTEQAENISSKVYFMSGTNEGKSMVPNMERMVDLIKPKLKNEDDMVVKIVKGGKHNEKLWSREMADALVWLMKD
jgi:predicted alpha/beta superfamily hydrolase